MNILILLPLNIDTQLYILNGKFRIKNKNFEKNELIFIVCIYIYIFLASSKELDHWTRREVENDSPTCHSSSSGDSVRHV